MKSVSSIIAAPLLCLGLVAGITAEKSTHLTPEDAAPYHARAKQAIDAIPYNIGLWTGVDEKIPEAAVKLLKPNATLNRRYQDNSVVGRGAGALTVSVLIVQCRDSRDMVGHYPEVCYVNGGETLERKVPRTWQLGDVTVHGTEYTFTRPGKLHRRETCVYNFLVVPDYRDGEIWGIVPDMSGVNAAAEDYQRRHFGAAQFQFVMPAELSRVQRDRIFKELMAENVDVLKALRTTGPVE